MRASQRAMRPRLYVLSGLTLAVGLLVACRGPASSGAEEDAPIVKGTLDGDADDSVVLLVSTLGAGDHRCTATAIAPNLVLTARHCVTATTNLGSCTAHQEAPDGGFAGDDVDATKLQVFTGSKAPITAFIEKKTPAATGVKVFHTTDTTVCGDDVAIVLLDKALDVPVAPLRLDSGPTTNEPLVRVAFGKDENGELPQYRLSRGIFPKATPPAIQIAESEFVVSESGCEGDDGAPSLSKSTGAVVGVYSRHADGDEGDGGARTCLGIHAVNVDTKLASMKEVITAAFAEAQATPVLEPKADVSDAGSDKVPDEAGAYPTVPSYDTGRHAAGPLPNPSEDARWATDLGSVDAGAAAPKKEADSGCSMTGANGRTVSLFPLALVGLALAGIRRRRTS